MKTSLELIIESIKIPSCLKDALLSDKPILFYGRGNQGWICEDLLVNCLDLGERIKGYLVSDGLLMPVKWEGVSQLPVWEISKMPYNATEVVILMTMGVDTALKIKKQLESKGEYCVCVIEDWDVTNEALREISLIKTVRRYDGVLTPGKDFHVKDFVFPNPYENDMVYSMFLRECENIIGKRVLGEEKKNIDSEYERNEVSLKKGDVVIDAGANIGLFSALSNYLGCHVYAFEPVKSIAEFTKRVASNDSVTFQVIEKALSNNDGEQDFFEVEFANHYKSDSSKIRMNEKEPLKGFISKKVSTTTIDTVVEEYKLKKVDFIKADIEGAERLMLQGAKNTLRRFAPKLSICTYHLPDDKEILTNLILEANSDYKIEYAWDKLYAHVPTKVRGERQ